MKKLYMKKCTNSGKIKSIAYKGCASFLILLYSVVGIISQFPAFHNHGPVTSNTCCCKSDKSCDISHGHAHDSPVFDFHSDKQQAKHSHGPCMACMWQAMAKTVGADNISPPDFTLLIQRKNEIPDIVPAYCELVNIQNPRAPPV